MTMAILGPAIEALTVDLEDFWEAEEPKSFLKLDCFLGGEEDMGVCCNILGHLERSFIAPGPYALEAHSDRARQP